jgi:hypothetical protein
LISRKGPQYYCGTCGFAHTRTEADWICHYCLEHKNPKALFPQSAYYNYGFKKCDVIICEDFLQQGNNRQFFNYIQRIAPVIMAESAYNAICKVVKEKPAAASNAISADNNNNNNDNYDPINYYQAVKIAFNENQFLKQYLNIDNEDKIDKDLQVLWPFTYKIANEEKDRIEIVSMDKEEHPNNLLILCIPGKLTRPEEISKQGS